MEGGLCYFHAKPDKAAELGRNGGRHSKQTYEQSTEHIAVPESAADVKRMLAETMAEVKAGRMDPKVANTVAYVQVRTKSSKGRTQLYQNMEPGVYLKVESVVESAVQCYGRSPPRINGRIMHRAEQSEGELHPKPSI